LLLPRTQERNHGVEFAAFVEMVQSVGEEEQLLSGSQQRRSRLVPSSVIRLFVASLADGMASHMAAFTSACDDGELQDVLRRAEAAAEQALSKHLSSGGGGGMTPLRFQQLHL
jgi:hypothetical protein